MTTKIEVRKQLMANFLNAAREKSILIEGDPDGLWFMLKHIRLGRERCKLDTCAMVKFIGPNELVILIPDKIDTHCDIFTCEYFFQKCTFIKGWRAICPHIITENGNDLLTLAQRIAGLISNPDLCGIYGCGKRYTLKPGLDNKPLVQQEKASSDNLKINKLKQSITGLLDAAKGKTNQIEGDPEGLWFLLHGIALKREGKKSHTDILVKFLNDHNPIILLPDKLLLDGSCKHFIQKYTFIKGWKAICPYVTTDIFDDMFEFIKQLAGSIGNPWFCSIKNCDKWSYPNLEETDDDPIPF